MTVAEDYAMALEALRAAVAAALPSVGFTKSVVGVPVLATFSEADGLPVEGVPEVELPVLVIVNKAGTGAMAVIPLRLFERGTVLASVGFAGSLAPTINKDVLEGLAYRDASWHYLGRQPLPTRRFPTLDLLPKLVEVLENGAAG